MQKQYSHNNRAGCVTERTNRLSGAPISVYHAEQARLDTEAGAWATVCERHGAICNHRTLSLAIYHMTSPDWCEDCAAIIAARLSREATAADVLARAADAQAAPDDSAAQRRHYAAGQAHEIEQLADQLDLSRQALPNRPPERWDSCVCCSAAFVRFNFEPRRMCDPCCAGDCDHPAYYHPARALLHTHADTPLYATTLDALDQFSRAERQLYHAEHQLATALANYNTSEHTLADLVDLAEQIAAFDAAGAIFVACYAQLDAGELSPAALKRDSTLGGRRVPIRN